MAGRMGGRVVLQVAGVVVSLAAVTASAAPRASSVLDVGGLTAFAGAASASAAVPPPLDGGGARPLPQPAAAAPAALASGAGAPVLQVPGEARLPSTVFDAYRKAEASLAVSAPGCHLPWQLLAGIGEVESGQAGGGRVDAAGTTYTPILGPVLDGHGFAAIPDTDGGRYDGSAVWDRAVGPMQFIPSTWAVWGADGNGDGRADPNNVWDAALAAGRYLCADGRDLAVPGQLDRAVLGYNHSTEYLRTVRAWMVHFRTGTSVVADEPARPTPAPPAVPAPSPSLSPSPSPTAGAGATPRPPVTASPSPSSSPTASASPTGPAPSPSPTPSGSPSGCPSPTAAPTGTPTGPASPTPAPSATPSPSPSVSPSPSAVPPSPTPSASPTQGCGSPSPNSSGSPTPTPSTQHP